MKVIILNKKILFSVYFLLIVLSCLGFEARFYIPFYLAFAFLLAGFIFLEKGRGKN